MKVTLIDYESTVEETREIKNFKHLTICFDGNRFNIYKDGKDMGFTPCVSTDFSIEMEAA